MRQALNACLGHAHHILPFLQEAIRLGRTAVDVTPMGHPDRARQLNSLAVNFSVRYQRTGAIDDLHETIRLLQATVDATPENHPDRARRLNSLGLGFHSRYRRTWSIDDLQEAIRLFQAALDANLKNHPDRARYLNDLGNAFRDQYRRTGSIDDLHEAIRLFQATVDATPEDHPDRARRLNSLGLGFGDRYGRTGSIDDLQEAIRLFQAAVDTTPKDRPYRAKYLNNLGSGLRDRYQETGAMDDLREAISRFQAAVDATPEGRPDRATYLANLGNGLRSRYQEIGAIDNLQEAIHQFQAAVDATPEHHPDRAKYLNNLGNGFRDRYQKTRAIDDLQEAIRQFQAAVNAAPEDRLNRVRYLNSLGLGLFDRYQRTWSIYELQESIRLFQAALDVTPKDHPDRARMLASLGLGVYSRYQRAGAIDDLQEAIRLFQAAVDATSEDHLDRARYLHSLGLAFGDRYHRVGSIDDLQEAIRLFQVVVDATPKDHLDRAERLGSLGLGFHDRYRRTGSVDDLEEAFGHFAKSLNQSSGPPLACLLSGKRAAALAIEIQDWGKGALYLAKTLDLLPKVAPRSISNDDLQYVLRQLTGFAALAASVFLRAGKPTLESLQILERGRGVISSLVMDLRSDVSLLQKSYPDLWSRYCRLREAVAAPASFMDRNSSTDGLLSAGDYSSVSSQRLQDVRDLDGVEEEIRKKPGFERFQLAPTGEELHSLARNGPVVSFNVTGPGSHAFLITGDNIRVLALPKLILEDLQKHVSKKTYGNRSRRDAKLVSLDGNSKIVSNLDAKTTQVESMRWLWDVAVKPVLKELGLLWQDKPPHTLPCVWWVGGGLMALLPLHAAGEHGIGSTDNTLSHVVSSYAPTLKALQFSQSKPWTPLTAEGSKVLVVAMHETPGHADLKVGEEVAAVRQHIGASASVEVMEAPTAAAVLEKVTACSLVHFACHGSSDAEQPSKSALLLGRGSVDKMTVEDLQSLNSLAQVAYLSACSTAEVGARSLIDESIHLASTFQLVGFRHVIGTMWGAYDSAAVAVAAKFYEYLLKEHADTVSSVPRALHRAVLDLKTKDGNSDDISLWAPFVHLGP